MTRLYTPYLSFLETKIVKAFIQFSKIQNRRVFQFFKMRNFVFAGSEALAKAGVMPKMVGQLVTRAYDVRSCI